jgi:hypothetical protein
MLTLVVIELRMPILVAEATGSLLSGRPESVGAVYEKVSSFAEGMVAAQLARARGAMTLPLAQAGESSPMNLIRS